MPPIINVLLFIVLMALLSACGTGELTSSDCDNPALSNTADCQQQDKSRDITGNWFFKSVLNLSQCNVAQDYESIYSVTIELTDDKVVIISPFGTFDGSVSQNKLTWSGQYRDETIEKYLNYSNVDVVLKDLSLSGTGTIEVRASISGDLECEGSFDLTGNMILESDASLVAPQIKVLLPDEITDQTAKVRWIDRSINEEIFIIERSFSNAEGFEIISEMLANQGSYVDSGLTANTTYFYRIKASNNAGDSEYSAVIMLTTSSAPIRIPEAPTELNASSVQANAVELNWIDNSTNESGFIIERSEDQGQNYTKIDETSNGTSHYKNTGLKAATEYFYRIIAFNSAGNSKASEPLAITTSDLPPAAPTVLASGEKTEIAIFLSWQDNATNEENIIVERSNFPDSAYEIIATLGANSTGYQDKPLNPETNYCYRIKFSNAVGESAYSNILCETTNAPPLLSPDIPENFSVTNSKTSLNFVLTWKDVSNESYYEIERSNGTASSFKLIVKLDAGAETYADSDGLEEGTEYWYRLRATNSAGESGYTKLKNGVTVSNLPPAPHDIDIWAKKSSVQFRWVENPEIFNYRVERSTSPSGPFIDISGLLGTNVTSFEDKNLAPDTLYYYRIYTINELGERFVESTLNTFKDSDIPKIFSSEMLFNYDGWSVKDGIIDINNSSKSVCYFSGFWCQRMFRAKGFLQVFLAPGPFERVINELSYIMTIFTDKNATGNADNVDYYINTVSIDYYFPVNRLSITRSVRKGLPTPLLSTALSGSTHLFQGEISGTLINEYNTRTGQTIPRLPAEPFTVKFTYDANVEEQIVYRQWPQPILTSLNTLHPAIRSLEISTGGKIWNRVAGGFSPPAPTPPIMRIRNGRFEHYG